MKKDQDHLISVFFLCARGRDPNPRMFCATKRIRGFGVAPRNSEKVYFYQNEQAKEQQAATSLHPSQDVYDLKDLFRGLFC